MIDTIFTAEGESENRRPHLEASHVACPPSRTHHLPSTNVQVTPFHSIVMNHRIMPSPSSRLPCVRMCGLGQLQERVKE